MTDAELLDRALHRDPRALRRLAGRAVKQLDTRALTAAERTFVHGVTTHGNLSLAAREAGLEESHANELLRTPHVARAIETIYRRAERQAGVDLSKAILLKELAWAIQQAKHAVRTVQTLKQRYTCAKCGVEREVVFELRSQPREVAQLAIAVTRAVEVAAKVTGQMQRGLERPPQLVATSYAEVVDMLREKPTAFTPAQRAELQEAARADRERIDELLALLARPAH